MKHYSEAYTLLNNKRTGNVIEEHVPRLFYVSWHQLGFAKLLSEDNT